MEDTRILLVMYRARIRNYDCIMELFVCQILFSFTMTYSEVDYSDDDGMSYSDDCEDDTGDDDDDDVDLYSSSPFRNSGGISF